MFTLRRRRDAFRFLLPKEFIPKEVTEKYSKILKEKRSFYNRPIDFLNESIQKIDVFGFNNGTMQQPQTNHNMPLRNPKRIGENMFQGAAADNNYRSADSILKMLDRTLNIEFRHTLGNLNYFILLESLIYQHSRDTSSKSLLDYNFKIELLNENGSAYANIVLIQPLIDGLDMLSFDNTSIVGQTESFKCIFKYNNFEYQFIETDANTGIIDLDDYLKDLEQDHPFTIPGLPSVKNSRRIPKFKSNSPLDYIPGGLPYEENNGIGDGQIFYDDEGGILKDMVHHQHTNTPGRLTNDNSPNDNSNDNSFTGDSSNLPNTPNTPNNPDNSPEQNPDNSDKDINDDMKINKPKEIDPGSFINIIASGKMEYSDGLAENEKFLYYPYEKDYENKKKLLSTFDIKTTIDKSETKIDKEGNPTDIYPNKSEFKHWEDLDFSKFRHKK